jgi:phage terminase large subunit-like protein
MSWQRKLERAHEINREIERDEPAAGSAVPELTPENTKTAAKFAKTFLRFEAKPYQEKLLDEESKRIAVIWPRQSGKSTTLAARMIWYASTHERTLSLIVAPGLRQSMILMDRIQAFIMVMPKPVRRKLISKMQRTVIWFKGGSQIVALPNSPNCIAIG